MDCLFLSCFESSSEGRIEPSVAEHTRWVPGGKAMLRVAQTQLEHGEVELGWVKYVAPVGEGSKRR
jgi:hypothetical protein